eukprot:13711864-Heterocapsa_arctica.AAC.1
MPVLRPALPRGGLLQARRPAWLWRLVATAGEARRTAGRLVASLLGNGCRRLVAAAVGGGVLRRSEKTAPPPT